MKLFRLKKEATPFFKDGWNCEVQDEETWNRDFHVDSKALEEITPPYLTYGHEKTKHVNDLSSWSSNGDHTGSSFMFTIHFPDVKYQEHDRLCHGEFVGDLMREIQTLINDFIERNPVK